ncbi:MAG: hypothetical protein JWN33_595 [Candidatus Saccharibacteria bacterium]|nr:hypothetical protein [Candidatus Saccharibacteria bacterium]
MSPRDTERIITDNPPSPEQLHKLMTMSTSAAAERKKLRQSQWSSRSRGFVEDVDLTDDLPRDDGVFDARHVMSAIVKATRYVDSGQQSQWNMTVFDTFFVDKRGVRSIYKFEWNRLRTLNSQRYVKTLGFGALKSRDTLADEIDNFSISDLELSLWFAEAQMAAVTMEECENLIADMTDHFNGVNLLYPPNK